MNKQDYPKWKYAQGDAKIVQNAEEEAALEGKWYDSPADVPAPKAPKAAKTAVGASEAASE